MTTPRPDETGANQNSSYRDTRSRSLQRIVRPIVLAPWTKRNIHRCFKLMQETWPQPNKLDAHPQ